MTRGADVLVVGARCAGSTLATFLARKGAEVIVVDKDDFPSDQPMSTHFIGAHGVSILEELGLAERLRKIATPVTLAALGVEEHVAWAPLDKTASFSPRRTELDAMLSDVAREAGA